MAENLGIHSTHHRYSFTI